MIKKLDLSIIILSYNTKDLTLACLRSIFKYTKGVNFEIIVVDNHSSDDSVSAIKKFATGKPVKLMASSKNLGFAAGNNLGSKSARGRYLLFLNSDTYLKKNILKPILNFADQQPNLGALSCRLKNKDGSTQPTGGFFPSLSNIFAWQFFLDDLPLISSFFKSIHPKSSFYHTHQQPDWLTGAFLLVPTDLFTQIKGFDPHFFMYVEDIEICYRLHQLHKTIHYLPQFDLVHLGGASASSGYSLIQEAKNISYFFQKHHTSLQAGLVRLFIRLGSLLRILVFGIMSANVQKTKIYWTIFTTRLNN